MNSLIILDYRNGRVIILPYTEGDGDGEVVVQKWVDDNQASIENCNWMVWDGEIEDRR